MFSIDRGCVGIVDGPTFCTLKLHVFEMHRIQCEVLDVNFEENLVPFRGFEKCRGGHGRMDFGFDRERVGDL